MSENHLQEAKTLFAQGENDLAALHFQMAFIEAPDNPDILYHLGLLNLGQPADAVEYFEKALSQQPSFSECHFELGRLYFYQKEFEKAIEHLETSTKLMPGHALSHYYLGYLYREVGLTTEAVRTLQTYLQLQPNHYEVHLELGHMYSYLGYKEQAAQSYLDAADCHEEKGVEALIYWLEVVSESKVHKKIEFFIGLARTFPEHQSTLALQVAMMMEENGEIEEAKKCLQMALEDPALTNRSAWELKARLTTPRILLDEKGQQQVEADIASVFDPTHLQLSPALLNLENLWSYLSTWKPFLFLPEYGLPALEWRQKYDSLFDTLLPVHPKTERTQLRDKRRRLGVFMYSHPSEFLTLSPLLAQLAQGDLELFLIYEDQYAHTSLPSYLIHNQVHTLILEDEFKYHTEQILALDLDFLFFPNLRINTLKQTHLASYRLAPVQLTTWYQTGSSGRQHLDYYLSSEHLSLDSKNYSEKLVELPGLPAVFEVLPPVTLQLKRPDYSLPDTGPLILCPYFLTAYQYGFDTLLKALLTEHPTAHMVFLDKPPGSNLHAQLLKRFEADFPHLMDRIWFLPHLTDEQEYNIFALSDVILEPPIGDVHVAYWAYSLGIPLVAHWSPYSIARAFDHRAGLPSPQDEAGYLKLANEILSDTQDLAAERHHQMRQAPILGDLTYAQALTDFLTGL